MIDERAHPALVDATRLLDCPVLKFKHRDPQDFARAIQRCGPGSRPIALTDGMFSRDGSTAPLRVYLDFLPRDGVLLVDDAHGAGVLGTTGKGTTELERAKGPRVIQCITLSKAFGSAGGAILGTRELRHELLAKSPMVIGSTPLALPLAAAALAAVRILRRDGRFRARLSQNTAYVRSALREVGYEFADNPGPILSLPISEKRQAARLHRLLLGAGIYPPFITYPGGPSGGQFRFVISSEHSRGQLDNLMKALVEYAEPGSRRPKHRTSNHLRQGYGGQAIER